MLCRRPLGRLPHGPRPTCSKATRATSDNTTEGRLLPCPSTPARSRSRETLKMMSNPLSPGHGTIYPVPREEDLQRQVERLRKERDSILNPPPDELAKRISLSREFAEIDEGNDKWDTKAVEQRVGAFFESKGVDLPRSILTVEAELLGAEAGLANARGQPVAF